jgi:DNA-binding Lrp family transcriptional regulator
LDAIDKAIINHLQDDASITNLELSQRIELSPPALQKRLRKLEDKGIIEHVVALVNRERVGFDLLCFVQVNLRHHEVQVVKEFKVAVQDMTEVLECYHLTGEMDYLLKVVVRNRKHLERFLIDTLTPAPGVDKIRTSLVLSDVKVTTKLPIE